MFNTSQHGCHLEDLFQACALSLPVTFLTGDHVYKSDLSEISISASLTRDLGMRLIASHHCDQFTHGGKTIKAPQQEFKRKDSVFVSECPVEAERHRKTFTKCQRKKKNLPTTVLVSMFIKPFQLLRRELPLHAIFVPTFPPCSWP